MKEKERVGLGEIGYYDTYMTLVVVSMMDMSRPLPSMMKWRYVIISWYFLYNPVHDPIVLNVLPGYVIRWGHVITKIGDEFLCSM